MKENKIKKDVNELSDENLESASGGAIILRSKNHRMWMEEMNARHAKRFKENKEIFGNNQNG